MSDEIIRLVVLLLVFTATLLGIEGGAGWLSSARRERNAINQRLTLIGRGMDREQVYSRLRRAIDAPLFQGTRLAGLFRPFDRMIVEAGIRLSSRRILFLMLVASVVVGLIFVLIAMAGGMPMSAGGVLMITLVAGFLGICLPLLVISRKRDKRRRKLIEQFPVALDIFVRGLRAGHPVGSALELLTSDMADPIGSEFGIVIDEVTYGLDLRTSLQNMADRCGVEDMHMFVVSLSVQTETGGNLAEILEGLSAVIRARASMLMKVRALSSEGRMSGVMLTALPALTFSGLFIINSRFYLDVADDPAFFPGFGVLLLLYLIGVLTIRRMVDLKV